MNANLSQMRANESPHQRTQWPWLRLRLLMSLVGGVVLAFFLARWFFGDSTPELDARAFAAAQSRWREANIRNYRIEVDVQTRQLDHYAVDVREGEPTQAWLNERPIKQARVFDTWTVPGMFITIGDDIARGESQASSANSVTNTPLTLRCTFHEHNGAPVRYHRIDFQNHAEVTWTITKLDQFDDRGEAQSLLPPASPEGN